MDKVFCIVRHSRERTELMRKEDLDFENYEFIAICATPSELEEWAHKDCAFFFKSLKEV